MWYAFTPFRKRYHALLQQPTSEDENNLVRSMKDICDDAEAARPCRQHFQLSAINTILLGLCLVCLVFLTRRICGINRPQLPCTQESNSDMFNTRLGRDTAYMTLDHAYDNLWDVMLVDHLGEFATPDDEYKRGEYSMFHQLRCLARFRQAMQRASEGRNIGKDFRDDHWAHCFDYMRRIILCNADRTIERPRIAVPQQGGKVHLGIEGAEEIRTCRPIQPLCDELRARGIANASCISELNNTLLPWKIPK